MNDQIKAVPMTVPDLVIGRIGGKCANCSFEYWEYQGHLIPCPRCEIERLRGERDKALAAVSDADVNVVAGGGAIFKRWIKWHEKHAEVIALANKERK